MSTRGATNTDRELALRLAACASLGAGVVHLAVVPAHWGEWVASGQFFIGLACFQLVWSHLVTVRPTGAVLGSGVLVNLASAALWVLSRIHGPPAGPHAGEPEPVQAAGVCVLLLQLYVVMGAGWVWHRGRSGSPVPAYVGAALTVVFVAVIAMSSGLGVVSGLQHDHGSPITAESHHHAPAPSQHHAPAPAVPNHPAVAPTQAIPPPPHTDHHH